MILHITGWMIRSDNRLPNWLWLRLARWLYGREERQYARWMEEANETT